MQVYELPTETVATVATGGANAAISTAWFLRRTALWLLFVGLGVAGACLLYTAESSAEAQGATPATTGSF